MKADGSSSARRYRLSFTQESLWLAQQLLPGSTRFNLTPIRRLTGTLDIAALRGAIVELTRRHESLRSTFPVHDGSPVALVHDTPEPDFVIHRVEDERDELESRLHEAVSYVPDMAERPPWRVTLLTTGPRAHLLCLCANSLVMDGFSTQVFFNQLLALYDAHPSYATVPAPAALSQVLESRQDTAARARWDEELSFWRQRLSRALPVLDIGTGELPPGRQPSEAHHEVIHLHQDQRQRLLALCQGEGATPFMGVLAAVNALLVRLSGQRDVMLTAPVAMRTKPSDKQVIGCLFNRVALRSRVSGDPTFRQLVQLSRRVVVAALAHREVPFELVELEALERPTASLRASLVMFSFAGGHKSRTLKVEPYAFEVPVTHQDLHIEATLPLEGGVRLRVDCACDAFSSSQAASLAHQLKEVLERVLADPEVTLSALAVRPLPARPRKRSLPRGWVRSGVRRVSRPSVGPAAGGAVEVHHVVASEAIERVLLRIWREALQNETLEPSDDFFEVGGTSIQAIRLLRAVKAEFGITLPPRLMFEASTVIEMARLLVEPDRHAAVAPGGPARFSLP
jgi:hypothetical protein